MTRTFLALAALCLLACSPVEPGDGQADSADAPGARAKSAAAAPASRARSARAAQRPSPAQASGAYQYVDERGRVQFAARLEDVPERQRSTAGHISVAPAAPRRRAAEPEVAEAHATTNAPVVVYTTRTCPYCRAAIAYMERIGQDYENKDVEADEDARDEYLQVTGGERGVPVIVVGRAWMQGWDQRQFDKLLADAN
jgi:glutaredoxin 3